MTNMSSTGTITRANGHTVPFLLRPSGPMAPWPRAPEPPPGTRLLPLATAPRQDPTPAATPAPRDPWWSNLRAPGGDTVITWAMAATVALVAVDAAIVSYSHIYGLASGQWGSGAETGVQARLLPLSIDGVIAEASLVMLYAARHKVRTPWLARFMLILGIAATVAANVTHGLPSSLLSTSVHIAIGALLSAWPAGAFIGSVEMAMRLVRDVRTVADGDTPGRRRRRWRSWRRHEEAAPATSPAPDASASATAASATAEAAPPEPPAQAAANPPAAPAQPAGHHRHATRKRQPAPRQRKPDGTKLAAAMALLDRDPAMSVSDLMAQGVTEGTARRAKSKHADG